MNDKTSEISQKVDELIVKLESFCQYGKKPIEKLDDLTDQSYQVFKDTGEGLFSPLGLKTNLLRWYWNAIHSLPYAEKNFARNWRSTFKNPDEGMRDNRDWDYFFVIQKKYQKSLEEEEYQEQLCKNEV